MRHLLAVAFMTLPLAAQTKTKVEVGTIPQEAELIVASAMAGEKSDLGYPSNELYVADSEGGHLTRITFNRKLYNHFAVSPNRKMIVASRYSEGDTNKNGVLDGMDRKIVYIIDLEHKEEWPLIPQYDSGWGGVDWTADGQWVVFSSVVDGKMDIYRMHPDGSGMENLTRNVHKLLGLKDPIKFVSDVSTSFDNKSIVFLAHLEGKPHPIVMERIDGTAAQFVTDGGGPNAKAAPGSMWSPGDFDPEVSPDNQHVCFQRSTPVGLVGKSTTSDIMTIKIDGTELHRISPEGNKTVHGICDWSADNRIVFSEWSAAWFGPVVANADGTNYHKIMKLSRCSHVRWIPPVEK